MCNSFTACDPVDIVIIIDSSGSIGQDNYFNFVIPFVEALIERLPIGVNDVHVGALIFSEVCKVEYYLDEHFDKASLLNATANIEYFSSKTNTYCGLNMAQSFFDTANGDRDTVRDMSILIADGVSNVNADLTLSEADALKATGKTQFILLIY